MISAEKNHFFHQESEEDVGLVVWLESLRSLGPLRTLRLRQSSFPIDA
jgi:hypothetical protein